jgi:hypothetical protein
MKNTASINYTTRNIQKECRNLMHFYYLLKLSSVPFASNQPDNNAH